MTETFITSLIIIALVLILFDGLFKGKGGKA